MQGDKTKWEIRSVFPGFHTKRDPSKTPPGACIAGQNVTFTDGDRISVRELGYETYPSTTSISAATTKVQSIRTFRRRDGEQILMRNQSDKLQFFDETTTAWVQIESGFTAGFRFGYAEANINTDQQSYIYLCNADQPYARWTGAHSHLTTAVTPSDTSVVVVDATDFPQPTGTIVIAGIKSYYSSRTSTTFSLTDTVGATAAIGSVVCAGLHNFSTAPRGNILIANDNRIWMAGITSTLAAVYFSGYGDATDWVGASLVTDSTADSPGIFNLAEGGGPVNGMAFDENATYIIKRNLIYKATLSDSLYSITPLKSFDGKSQTTGGLSEPFAGENGMFFITPDKKIYHLTRVENVDVPQLVPVSDPIKATVEDLHFEKARGIVFEDKAFIACSSAKGRENDRVLIYDIVNRLWHTPVTGWNVTDWAIYKKTIGTESDDELFFASNNSLNVFKVTNVPVDGAGEVEANGTMTQETFGMPAQRKYIDNFFVEGYIDQDTTLTITLLFDDGGYTQSLSATIKGTDTAYLFTGDGTNPFGANPFGYDVFGSSTEGTSLKKFRIYTKNTLRDIPFYSLSCKLSSDGSNQRWAVINYGFKVGVYSQEEARTLYKGFT